MGFHLPFFPFYAAETLADGRVQSWTLEQFGAFTRLLCCQWNDGDIPAGPTQLGRLLGVSAQEMTGIWAAIGDRFPEAPGRPGRLQNPRLEEERDKALALSAMRSQVGAKGASARWHKDKQLDGKGMRLPLPKQCQADGKPMPETIIGPSSDRTEEEACGEVVPAVLESDSPVAVSLPCSGSAKSYGVTLAQIASWQIAYPGVDVLAEVEKARVWLEANPTRRKTHGGMARFLVSWMNRAQDSPRAGVRKPAADNGRPDLSQMDYSKPPEF